MPSRRTDERWSNLTDRYKERLRDAGINKADWLEGASLRSIPDVSDERLHEAVANLTFGAQSYEDERVMRRWYAGGEVPPELQEYGDLTPASAAVLAQVGELDDWTSATLVPHTLASGEPWTLRVEHADGSTSIVPVPNDVEVVGDLRDWLDDYEDDISDFEWDIEES
jgi:hypothetical protein